MSIREAFRVVPPAPRPGVFLDLVHHQARGIEPEFYTLRMYRDNLNGLDMSGEDAVAIHNWVSDIMRTLRVVEPTLSLEIYDRMPRRN